MCLALDQFYVKQSLEIFHRKYVMKTKHAEITCTGCIRIIFTLISNDDVVETKVIGYDVEFLT